MSLQLWPFIMWRKLLTSTLSLELILNLKSRLVRIILKEDVLVAATQIMQRNVIFNHQIVFHWRKENADESYN